VKILKQIARGRIKFKNRSNKKDRYKTNKDAHLRRFIPKILSSLLNSARVERTSCKRVALTDFLFSYVKEGAGDECGAGQLLLPHLRHLCNVDDRFHLPYV
jgi:hypothetical protein